MRRLLRIFLLIALFAALLSGASQLYCGPTATGAGNGVNWDNQCNLNTATLVRGNIYYIADGSYSRTFATAASGVDLIIIKKATVTDHGTDVGWSNAFDDSQAVFGFTTPYWHFDGGRGGGPSNNWTGQGIRITTYDAVPNVDENNDYVTLDRVEINVGSVGPDSSNAVVVDHQNHLTIRRSYIHDIGCDVFKMRYGADDFTLELTKVARSYQDAGGCHVSPVDDSMESV
jgi:hypothetical protein